MIAILVSLAFFAAFAPLARYVAQQTGIGIGWVWLAYYAGSEWLDRSRLTHAPSWRASRLAAYLGRVVMRTRFSSLGVLDSLGAGPHMFVCEPHGVACLHLVFGFAAHGGALPEHVASRTLVVAHWLYKLVPILRNIYAVFGVIDNSAYAIECALDEGYSVALIPSALVGKDRSLTWTDDSKDEDARTVVWRRSQLGWAVYAARRRASVVPVLSPREDEAYRRGMTHFAWPFVLPLGWWFIRPVVDIEFRVGAPIAHGTHATLAARTYATLRELGAPTHHVDVKHAQ